MLTQATPQDWRVSCSHPRRKGWLPGHDRRNWPPEFSDEEIERLRRVLCPLDKTTQDPRRTLRMRRTGAWLW